MQTLVLLMIVSVVTFPFLTKSGVLPKFADFAPEVIAAFVVVAVVTQGVRNRFQYVRPAYWIVLGAIAFNMICGVLVNAVDAGPVFAGIRTYFRAMPFFLLPAVFAFSEKQISQQFALILGLAFIQTPIAIYQRLQPYVTGDSVYGTLMISSFLSIFLIGVACMLTGFYLKKRLRLTTYLLLMLVIMVPTLINETKGTLVLFPVALIVTFLVSARRGARLKSLVGATVVSALLVGIFVPIYDYTQRDREDRYLQETPTVSNWLRSGRIHEYLYKGSRGVGAAEQQDVGRLDALVVPLQYLAKDPVRLAFGVGLGNASQSSLGRSFTGEYFRALEFYLLHTIARVMAETGLIGLALLLVLISQIFMDSRRLAGGDQGVRGASAAGWAGITVMVMIGMSYKDLVFSPALTYLFWYISGLVAAEVVRTGRSRTRGHVSESGA